MNIDPESLKCKMRGKRIWQVNIQRATDFDFFWVMKKRKYMVNVNATQSVQINKLLRKTDSLGADGEVLT
jgi:hypothetical protein